MEPTPLTARTTGGSPPPPRCDLDQIRMHFSFKRAPLNETWLALAGNMTFSSWACSRHRRRRCRRMLGGRISRLLSSFSTHTVWASGSFVSIWGFKKNHFSTPPAPFLCTHVCACFHHEHFLVIYLNEDPEIKSAHKSPWGWWWWWRLWRWWRWRYLKRSRWLKPKPRHRLPQTPFSTIFRLNHEAVETFYD